LTSYKTNRSGYGTLKSTRWKMGEEQKKSHLKEKPKILPLPNGPY